MIYLGEEVVSKSFLAPPKPSKKSKKKEIKKLKKKIRKLEKKCKKMEYILSKCLS